MQRVAIHMTRRSAGGCCWMAGALALALSASAGLANELHVPAQYPTIQAAINASAHGDTVIVADGVYTGAGNINISFRGQGITVRSASGPELTTIDAERNGSVFIFNNNEDRASVVEGFTIRGANRSGIHISGASPTIRDCIIFDNWNGAIGGGGLLVENGGNPLIVDSVIDRNLASQGGGILLWEESEATVRNTTISRNRVDIVGGGAAMADLGSILIIESCIIRANESVGFIGSSAGVRIARASKASIINSLFHNNTAASNGAGISFTNDASGEVINCTIADNHASGGSGILITSNVRSVSIANTILWNNFPDAIMHGGGNLEVSYSVIEHGWPGTGNHMDDPQFVSPGGRDYTPSAAHVIDAGNNTVLPPHITEDLAGNPRFVSLPSAGGGGVPGGTGGSAIVDIGAYEVQSTGICYANCDGSTTEPILTVNDFTCFINEFAAAQTLPHEQQVTHYANCDSSTTPPVLTVNDFTCFINAFAQGCS